MREVLRKKIGSCAAVLALFGSGCLPSGGVSSAPPLCGNGSLDPGEICEEGETAVCADLGATFLAGAANCRSDCRGFDVSSCTIKQNAAGTIAEYVIPKARDSRAWRDAMCSDQEPYAYQVSLSPTKSKNWVIFLVGGGLCDGVYFPCTNRNLSLFAPPTTRDGKIVSSFGTDHGVTSRDPTENPTFWDANMVRLPYCTNDLWSGTNVSPTTVLVGPTASPSPMPVVFTGRNNVQATFESLARWYGLNDTDSSIRVLLTGSSAGGIGVQVSGDLAKRVIPLAVADRRLWLASTAGSLVATWNDPVFDLKYSNAGSELTDADFADYLERRFKAVFSDDCVALAQASGLRRSACYTGYLSYRAMTERMNYRVLLEKNRLDQLYMGQHMIPPESASLTSHEREARELWLQKNDAELSIVKWLWSPADPMVVSGGSSESNFHEIYSEKWGLLPPSGISANICGATAPTSFRDLLTRFWNAPKDPTLDPGERYCYDGDWVK